MPRRLVRIIPNPRRARGFGDLLPQQLGRSRSVISIFYWPKIFAQLVEDRKRSLFAISEKADESFVWQYALPVAAISLGRGLAQTRQISTEH